MMRDHPEQACRNTTLRPPTLIMPRRKPRGQKTIPCSNNTRGPSEPKYLSAGLQSRTSRGRDHTVQSRHILPSWSGSNFQKSSLPAHGALSTHLHTAQHTTAAHYRVHRTQDSPHHNRGTTAAEQPPPHTEANLRTPPHCDKPLPRLPHTDSSASHRARGPYRAHFYNQGRWSSTSKRRVASKTLTRRPNLIHPRSDTLHSPQPDRRHPIDDKQGHAPPGPDPQCPSNHPSTTLPHGTTKPLANPTTYRSPQP